jgi:AraC-like DNA-binding protein
MGIVEFVHRTRAEEACRLLRMTEDPVGRIASRVGYDEIAYFSRCFRGQIGQSPRAYRRAWHGER